MPKAIRIYENGGPEVLRWEDVDVPPPGRGEVLLRHTAIGVNFLDTYHRSGLYKLPLPLTPGSEAVGTVTAIGDVECYRLDKAAFQDLMQQRPDLAGPMAAVLARRKAENDAVREGLDEEAKRRRLAEAESDLLGKIRNFFSLDGH